jgi:putative tryptophan/tyrosine transport system substrate-binding protein
MRRREFITLLGNAAGWPIAALAQQTPGTLRRIGVLFPLSADDPEAKARLTAFQQTLEQAGWVDGRNVHFDIRWSSGSEIDGYAAELVALKPDVILANGSGALTPLLKVTRTIPIVFTVVPDPVGSGFVQSLARPGGNATGFINFEYALSAKWLELLHQVAPTASRAAVILDPTANYGTGQFDAIQAASPSLGFRLTPINIRDAVAMERDIVAFAQEANSGLIATASALAAANRDQLVGLASRLKLPSVFFARHFAAAGGLISYGPNFVDQFRLAAGYVDRILRGGKASDLPVQTPTRYELIINLKTAKALGIEVPPTLLGRADEVIE